MGTLASFRSVSCLTSTAALVLLAGCANQGPVNGPFSRTSPKSSAVVAQNADAPSSVNAPQSRESTGSAMNAQREPEPPAPGVTRVTIAQEGADFDPCVTPDGEHIVFASTRHRPTADIYVKRADGQVMTQLTSDPADDAMPAVSPDGQRIAFASNRSGNWDIYVMPSTGGRAVQVTSDPADELHPSWSPDGTKLTFSRMGEASRRWEMWVTDASNSATANFIGYGLFPQWAPVAGTGSTGGDLILYQLGRERGKRTFGLWTLEYTDGQVTSKSEIASSSDTALINPTWSPDGQWIAYAEVPAITPDTPTSRASVFPTKGTMWMVGVDGSNKVQLASGPGASLMPTWSVNHRLFFVSNREGRESIWSMDMRSALLAATGYEHPGNARVANTPEPNDGEVPASHQ
ncbi:MAG: PD40 domain-containing protein [Phycisphaerales bacterium]|nr:MAG: PD40 domain-containing protein [Phycisphaerales bacterium]